MVGRNGRDVERAPRVLSAEDKIHCALLACTNWLTIRPEYDEVRMLVAIGSGTALLRVYREGFETKGMIYDLGKDAPPDPLEKCALLP